LADAQKKGKNHTIILKIPNFRNNIWIYWCPNTVRISKTTNF